MTASKHPPNGDIAGTLIAAAVGDVLGGPQEQAGAFSIVRDDTYLQAGFRAWLRFDRATRLWDYVAAGEYSDDTQLLLCVARSVLCGSDWLERWTHQELPLWVAYQRGGGTSTISAARSWLAGIPPWRSPLLAVRMRYFRAGGNGAAMRILPHCVMYRRDDLSTIARRITLDCLSTHGHPRALLGSLVYAYVLTHALRGRSITVAELPEAIAFADRAWSEFALDHDAVRERNQIVGRHSLGPNQGTWTEATMEMSEMVRCLTKADSSTNFDWLTRIGATETATKNLATVTVLAAVLFCETYRSQPLDGLVTAAFATGADTDTIASMTAALLAAHNPLRWTLRYETSLQDVHYIRRTGRRLWKGEQPVNHSRIYRLNGHSLELCREQLALTKIGGQVTLPDGRRASLSKDISFEASTRMLPSWYLIVDDGQTIHFRKQM